MPVVYANPTYPWQVSFAGQQAASTQLNYRQMLAEVTGWNPDVDSMTAGRWINNYYRKVIDMRSWYGLKIRGQASVGNIFQQGQVVTTQGSPIVNGIGTGWPTQPANVVGSIIGLQFRTSFTLNWQTITNVISPTQLQLDTPFPTVGLTSGYQICQVYLDFGANIKRLLWAVNQQQGWPMSVNGKVQGVNFKDTWRTNLGWSTALVPRSPSPAGGAIYECWPAPFQAQTFPFEAYMQPPDLVLDNDAMVPWIASDLIVTRAIADALVYRGRTSKYYDPQTAMTKKQEFNERVGEMMFADDNQDVQDVSWDYGQEDSPNELGLGLGATWSQNHA